VAREGFRQSSKSLVIAFLFAACSGQGGDTDAVPSTPAEANELEVAGRTVVRFLQGRVPFDSIALADSVTLHVAPEGGGGTAAYSRDELRDPASWTVVSDGRTFSLAPPAGSATLTTKTSRHFNCMEYDLASRSADLARLPHVGARLQSGEATSCLGSWNLTLVFDSMERPRLVAALYDQWEW
jgi:hypothetical protein